MSRRDSLNVRNQNGKLAPHRFSHSCSLTGMNAHDELDEGCEGQEEEDGGECDMVGIVDGFALRALELDLQGAIRNLVAVLHFGL